jgi:hypothetical protein
MAAARTAVRGLSPTDLQSIRDTLAAGRKPKVMFTDAAGQIAGQFGQVVQLTDPTVSDDWLVVRFGRDELPFSPTDLQLPPRGSATRREQPQRTPPPTPTAPAPPVPAPREEPIMPKAAAATARTTARTTGDDRPAEKPAEKPAVSPADRVPAANGAGPAPAAVEQPVAAKPARRQGKPARPRSGPALTVTLTYADGDWMVGATQGSKALAKPYVIRPAEALKMVSMLDVPGVHEAVEQIVSAERAEAQAQAERLRAELAEIEARLAELREV